MAKAAKVHDPNKVTNKACERCLALAHDGVIRFEAVMFLPQGSWAPLARDASGPCCYDCASADALMAFDAILDFNMARIAVANDRQEQFRLPKGARPEYGLAKDRLIRVLDIDLDQQHRWLDQVIPGWCGLEHNP